MARAQARGARPPWAARSAGRGSGTPATRRVNAHTHRSRRRRDAERAGGGAPRPAPPGPAHRPGRRAGSGWWTPRTWTGPPAPRGAPRGVHQTRYASFVPGLAARLVDTCLHELPRLLRPYALKLLKPRGSMARSTASCSTCTEVGYTAAVRTARVRAALHGMKKGSPRALAARRKGSTNTPSDNAAAAYIATLEKSRTLQADSSEYEERRCKPLRTFETVSVETAFHIISFRFVFLLYMAFCDNSSGRSPLSPPTLLVL